MSAVKHGFSAEVVERNPDGIAVAWLGACGLHERFVGPTYEVIEDKWRMHMFAVTGVAPKAMGGTVNRWQPADPDLARAKAEHIEDQNAEWHR